MVVNGYRPASLNAFAVFLNDPAIHECTTLGHKNLVAHIRIKSYY